MRCPLRHAARAPFNSFNLYNAAASFLPASHAPASSDGHEGRKSGKGQTSSPPVAMGSILLNRFG
jgi:hypothetical protein